MTDDFQWPFKLEERANATRYLHEIEHGCVQEGQEGFSC
jgi:hypothetical protein